MPGAFQGEYANGKQVASKATIRGPNPRSPANINLKVRSSKLVRAVALNFQGVLMHPKKKGIVTEQKVISYLLELDYGVSKPIGDNLRYDVIVDYKQRLYRCQIKTGRLRKGSILFNTQSKRINTKDSFSSSYVGQIDIFLIFCFETNGYYFLPISKAPSNGGSFRVALPKNKQNKGIVYAKDWLLDNMSAYLEKDRAESLKFGESLDEPIPSQAA